MKTICPVCEAGELNRKTITEVFEYKGQKTSVPDYVNWQCDECGEAIVDPDTMKSSGLILLKFKREVDKLLSPEEIKRIRKKLGYTQEAFSDLLGGGHKAFARYESGIITQSRAMDNLLWLLDKNPAAVKELENRYDYKHKRLNKTSVH